VNTTLTTDRKLSNLTKLRIEDHIDTEEFIHERDLLLRERLSLTQTLTTERATLGRFELSKTLVSFASAAAQCFNESDRDGRRLIASICGSNFVLKDQELSIDARLPFLPWPGMGSGSDLRRLVKDVRTFVSDPASRSWLESMKQLLEGHKRPRDSGAA
jgi:hypothetical protein